MGTIYSTYLKTYKEVILCRLYPESLRLFKVAYAPTLVEIYLGGVTEKRSGVFLSSSVNLAYPS